jgi:transcriptional regulator of arginine metabolism
MIMQVMSDRRQLIASLLDRRPVTSQPQLVELLADQGVHVTQATVSRDLERLGAVRVRKDGHLVYALPVEDEPADPTTRLREALRLVRGMESSANLAVLKTAPANAMPVARAFDVAELPEVAGTIAGDDVVLVIAREPSTGADVLDLCDRIGAEAAHANA